MRTKGGTWQDKERKQEGQGKEPERDIYTNMQGKMKVAEN